MKTKYILEGLDFLGKSSLADGIRNHYGYYEVIHYKKPELLSYYTGEKSERQFRYQQDGFRTMFDLLKSDGHLILDRGHLGEAVYSNIYRGYDGNYVFKLEQIFRADLMGDVRLILLTEDFSKSKHFKDDGQSFDITKREQEQNLFMVAFNKSIFPDKRIVCVTGEDGNFRAKEDILEEVTK